MFQYKDTNRFGLVESLRNCERYDIINKKWTRLASLPNSRAGLGAVTLDGKVYIIGGSKCKEW
jgi:N-acetylneuraminic acid mutarotase